MTSIRLTSGSVRPTLPKGARTAISIHDRDVLRTEFRVRCDRTGSDGPPDIVLGDGVDDDSTRTMSAVVRLHRVELRLPGCCRGVGIDGLDVEGPTLRPFGVAPTLT